MQEQQGNGPGEKPVEEEPKRIMRIGPRGGKSKKKQWKPTVFEKRVEARVAKRVQQEVDRRLQDAETRLAEKPALPQPSDQELANEPHAPAVSQVRRILQRAKLENDPEALRLLRQARGQGPQAELRLLGDLAELALRRVDKPAAKAGAVIVPSGGGVPTPDPRTEYEKRLQTLRPGDVGGLTELKREFRAKGLDVY
jgi:hypothetical protein